MLALLYHEIWTCSTVILHANSTMRFGVRHTYYKSLVHLERQYIRVHCTCKHLYVVLSLNRVRTITTRSRNTQVSQRVVTSTIHQGQPYQLCILCKACNPSWNDATCLKISEYMSPLLLSNWRDVFAGYAGMISVRPLPRQRQ